MAINLHNSDRCMCIGMCTNIHTTNGSLQLAESLNGVRDQYIHILYITVSNINSFRVTTTINFKQVTTGY